VTEQPSFNRRALKASISGLLEYKGAIVTLFTSDIELADEMAKYYADPLGFVRLAYPWGEKGTSLENEEGPDANQEQFLGDWACSKMLMFSRRPKTASFSLFHTVNRT